MEFLKDCLIKYRYPLAFLIRLTLIIFIEPIEKILGFTYTDIDYHVFSDGARYVFDPLGPYKRETYRYSPLLAIMMLPNIYFNYNFGKIVFIVCDTAVGGLIEYLIIIQGKNKEEKNVSSYVSLFYLYSPLSIAICTRGSSDCLITFLVILTVILLEKNRYILAGFIFGFSIHFKIYPIIYSLGFYLYIGLKNQVKSDNIQEVPKNIFLRIIKKILNIFTDTKNIISIVFNYKSIVFVIVTVTTFFTFFCIFYLIYGNIFVFETYIYHFVRKDHRHNYSLYFYMVYLTYTTIYAKILSLIAFFPQAFLVFIISMKFFKSINFCIFLQTSVFVVFNKVSTAQYFIWYFSLVPALIPYNEMFKSKKVYCLKLLFFWILFELIWNGYSNSLEYKGENSFLEIFLTNIGFFTVSVLLLKNFIKYQIK